MRIMWAILGLLSVALGAIGILLPLLPTVPFMLLAAFCFSRSSERLHHWLISHPTFGPPIEDWQSKGTIAPKVKRISTLSVGVVFVVSVILGVKTTVIIIQAVVLSLVLIFIWSRPNF